MKKTLALFLLFVFTNAALAQQKLFSQQVLEKAQKTIDTLVQATGYQIRFIPTAQYLPIPNKIIDTTHFDISGMSLEQMIERVIPSINEKDSAEKFLDQQAQQTKIDLQGQLPDLSKGRQFVIFNPQIGWLLTRKQRPKGKEFDEYFTSQFVFGEDIPEAIQAKLSAFKPSVSLTIREPNVSQNDKFLEEYVALLKNTFASWPSTKQKLKLEEVSFTNAIGVLDDDGTALTMPQWKNRAFRNTENPVCFVKKTTIKVSVKLSYKDALDKDKVFLKALVSNGSEIASTKASVDESKKEISLTDVSLNKELPDGVDVVDKLIITWQISLNGGSTWSDVGKSENRLYVVMETPLKPTQLYESLLYIGCKNAKGKTDEAGVFEGIWQYFSTRNTKDKKERTLSYYGDPFTGVYEVKDLLRDRTGQCGSFAKLLLDVLYAQGIDTRRGSGNYVFFEMAGHSGDKGYGFLVRNWSFGSSKTSGDTEFSYQNIPFAAKTTTGDIEDFIRNADKSYNWIGSPEVTDQPGVPGQNNSNPSSNFNNHQLVFYKGKFYDPSYGLSYNSETELSEKAIEAFYKEVTKPKNESEVGIDVNGNGVIGDDIPKYPIYFIQKNSTGLKIKISYGIY
jgi:hypothetical protein